MSRVRKSARAETDIRQIALWIARDSVDAGIKWTFALDNALARLADAPGSGTDRTDLRPGLRSSPFGNYLVFFKRIRDGIQVVRVIHGARDYSRFFRKG